MKKHAKKKKTHARRVEMALDAAVTRVLQPTEPEPTLVPTVDADEGEPVILALVPPDLDRCQCEWPDQSNQTFGPKPTTRCSRSPTVVAFQKRVVGDVEPTGAMALCDDHRILLEHMFAGQLYYRVITHNRQIGDLT